MAFSFRITASLCMLMALLGCEPSNKNDQKQGDEEIKSYGYDYTKPSQTFKLPKVLREISGIAPYQENQLLCVQDEEGEVFVYDLVEQKIVKQHRFDKDDDYEDVVKVESDIYVLRSDGTLLSFKWGDKETVEIDAALPGKNDVEGLTYDVVDNRLWLAVKEPSKKAAPNDERLIYSFDLRRRAVYQERKMEEKQFKNIGFKGKDWASFKPSGIAVHPKTGEVYLLSSAGRRLVIMTRAGVPLQNIALDADMYRQPEGICFTADGTLYISSEGDGKEGYILKFLPITP